MEKSKAELLLHVLGVLTLVTVSSWNGAPGVGVLAQTYTLSDGDIVTCIPIESQPSLNGTNGVYNKRPTTVIADPNPTTFPDTTAVLAIQTFAKEVESGCPDGSIPVTDKTLGTFQLEPKALKRKRYSPDDSSDESPHEYAIGIADVNSSIYRGTELVINIWDPAVANHAEFSLAQLWLVIYDAEGNPQNTVEVGYQVYDDLAGDFLSRLFVYWTADGYNQTGCYDLSCPGFVQVSNKVLLRGSFNPVSTPKGKPYEILLRVFKDDETKDWWLQLNGEYVGYWPAALYPAEGLQGPATSLQWGGEIAPDAASDGKHHTTTDMGSGSEGAAKSAYMRNLKYVDDNDQLLVANPFHVFNTSAPCYAALLGCEVQHPEWASYFYFGGPGYGPKCPVAPSDA